MEAATSYTPSLYSLVTKKRLRWTLVCVCVLTIVGLMSGTLGSHIEHARKIVNAVSEMGKNPPASRTRINHHNYYGVNASHHMGAMRYGGDDVTGYTKDKENQEAQHRGEEGMDTSEPPPVYTHEDARMLLENKNT